MSEPNLQTWLAELEKMMQEDSDDELPDESEEEEEEEQKRPLKKAKSEIAVASAAELSIDEALDITFAAFNLFIRRYFDGDVAYIDGAQAYSRRVVDRAREIKAQYGAAFDAGAIIAGFRKL